MWASECVCSKICEVLALDMSKEQLSKRLTTQYGDAVLGVAQKKIKILFLFFKKFMFMIYE